MKDFRPFLTATDDQLLYEIVSLQGGLATTQEELALARVAYESAYVSGLGQGANSVADRERTARSMALPLRVSVIELESRIRVLELSLELLHFLLESPHASRRSSVAPDQ